jgi:hypothetical protein
VAKTHYWVDLQEELVGLFRKHLRDVASVEGLSAIIINAHSTEVGSCTFDEQRSILEIAQEEIVGAVKIASASPRA